MIRTLIAITALALTVACQSNPTWHDWSIAYYQAAMQETDPQQKQYLLEMSRYYAELYAQALHDHATMKSGVAAATILRLNNNCYLAGQLVTCP